MNKIELFHVYQRRIFEYSSQDISDAKSFFANKKWGPDGCPFHLEWPYLNIPDMLKDKLTRHYLKIKS
jgi:hypothetical protein